MEVEIKQVFIRPNVDTPWIYETWTTEFRAQHREYIDTKYNQTGKYTGSFELSEDGLILVQTNLFSSPEAYEEFAADPYLSTMRDVRNDCNIKHNIITSIQ